MRFVYLVVIIVLLLQYVAIVIPALLLVIFVRCTGMLLCGGPKFAQLTDSHPHAPHPSQFLVSILYSVVYRL